MNLIWKKHSCGGLVAIIPKEFGGGSAHIVPKAFGGKRARLRLHDNPLQPYFFYHQFYASVSKAKAALVSKLSPRN